MSLVEYDNSSDESEEESKPVKKQKHSVKITIPSLKEFEDEDYDKPAVKKPKFQPGSGLFSLLPPPKNTPSVEKTGFVPHVLISKKEKPSPSVQSNNIATTEPIPLKTTTSSTSALILSEEQESDDENLSAKDSSNTVSSCDFFWLDDLASKNETKIKDPVSVSVKSGTFLKNLSSQEPCSSISNVHQIDLNETKKDAYLQQYQLPTVDTSQEEENAEYVASEQQCQSIDDSIVNSDGSNKSLLNDKEFLKLQGRRREFENVDIVDVNADDQLTNRNEWFMKSVTEETTYRPKKKHGLPTQQQKRKHQITYLAFQAKEREMDLKNQWAINRSTRRETQSKYGF